MANVEFQSEGMATPPQGTKVAVDEVSGLAYQRMKLVLGDDGSVDGDAKSISQKLRVSAMPYLYDIAEGNVPDHEALRKFGHNDDVGASEEIIWDGSAAYAFQTAAQALEVVSGDAADTSDGTGARTVQIYGLDENWNEQNETVTLNGTTAVDLVNTYIRVFRMIVRSAGTGGENAGVITCQLDGAGATQAVISAGMNQTLMAIWSVPDGYTLYLTRFYAATSAAKATKVYLRIRPFGEVFQVKKVISINAGTDDFPYDMPLVAAAKSDIYVSAEAAGGGGEVSAGFDGWYEL